MPQTVVSSDPTGTDPAFTARVWAALDADLRAYLGKRVTDVPTVDDLAQEVWLKVQRAAPPEHDNVAGWLFTIARNVLTDHHRRRQREANKGAGEGVTDAGLGLEPDESREALGRCLHHTVATLPPRLRDALELVDVQGVPRSDAARELKLSYSALRSRVQRGRAQLRKRLVRCCELERDARGGIMDYRRRSSAHSCCGADEDPMSCGPK